MAAAKTIFTLAHRNYLLLNKLFVIFKFIYSYITCYIYRI